MPVKRVPQHSAAWKIVLSFKTSDQLKSGGLQNDNLYLQLRRSQTRNFRHNVKYY